MVDGMKRRMRGWGLLLAVLLGVGALGVSQASAETVAAAASLQPVMEKLVVQFEADKGMKVQSVFDASGQPQVALYADERLRGDVVPAATSQAAAPAH